MPASLGTYSKVEVVYETMPGWTEDISTASSFEQLPKNCQAYVLRLEEVRFMILSHSFNSYFSKFLMIFITLLYYSILS